jgi:hypothetical protein
MKNQDQIEARIKAVWSQTRSKYAGQVQAAIDMAEKLLDLNNARMYVTKGQMCVITSRLNEEFELEAEMFPTLQGLGVDAVRAQIAPKPKVKVNMSQKIRDMWFSDDGATMVEIARELGVRYQMVYGVIKRANAKAGYDAGYGV